MLGQLTLSALLLSLLLGASGPAAVASGGGRTETGPGPSPAGREPGGDSTLDLESLERRLRQTDAMGFLTKLSLKNQVDDLLSQFRAYHRDERALSLEQLRERYNLLLLKVLSLLQDRDQALFRDLTASREALWSLLVDPARFRTL